MNFLNADWDTGEQPAQVRPVIVQQQPPTAPIARPRVRVRGRGMKKIILIILLIGLILLAVIAAPKIVEKVKGENKANTPQSMQTNQVATIDKNSYIGQVISEKHSSGYNSLEEDKKKEEKENQNIFESIGSWFSNLFEKIKGLFKDDEE